VSSIPRPDLSTRPLQMTCEYTVNAKPSEVYAAWTERFDTWFAQAGTLSMVPEPGRPYFFGHTSSTTGTNGAGIPTTAGSST
jgi:hypothetical protein